jgi:hypothetical protein
MIKISIDKAKPGMKLAQEIINDTGMIIVPAGIELTHSLIDKLARMNIDFLYVEGKRQLPPKEEVLRELEERFKKINDPQTLLIKQALKEHFEEIYK